MQIPESLLFVFGRVEYESCDGSPRWTSEVEQFDLES